ncbi:MAG: helix-turn-helix domain-containing protein [Spirochaetales bacterium]|jgi:transcriptional regulator with XRE-family HTH domain|nr:helix-turn-helix domain-containing protein [Spirochaetales bacterium]
MTDLKQLLASNMRFYRNKLGLSQSKLADKVDTATNYIAAIEAGRKFPSVKMLERIATALHLDTPELFSMQSIQMASINCLEKEILGEITQLVTDYMTKKTKLFSRL